jgi:iron complex outermembrane receptor protein
MSIQRRLGAARALKALLLAGAALSPITAHAQDSATARSSAAQASDASSLEDVVVTAERRESRLQRTAVSVGVLNAQQLERQGFNNLVDIERAVAGVSNKGGVTNQQASIIIRGVGTTNMGYTQAVGIYIDDVPLIRSAAAGQWDLPDIERVEVLRGPQGTLYGQNSSAGAVKVVSRNPTDQPLAWLSAGYGNYNAVDLRGYASGPLVEGLLAGSFAFSHRQHDGYGYNHVTEQSIFGADVTQARFKLRLTPNDDFDAVLAVDGLLDTSDNGTTGSPLNLVGVDVKPRDKYVDKDLSTSHLVRTGASLTLTYDVSDSLSLRSISAYRTYSHDPDPMDLGGIPRHAYEWSQSVDQDTFSQEVQAFGDFGKLNYTVGALFIREDWLNDNVGTYNLVATSAFVRRNSITHFDTDDVGVYAQFDYNLTDRLKVSAGARYYHTEQTYTASSYVLNANYAPVSQTFSVHDLEATASGVTPRLSISYQWTPETFVYLTYTEGAKFGGYNRSASSATVASVAADPETVTAYEGGVKTALFGGRLQANGTLFYNNYEDYLAIILNPTINGEYIIGSVLTNAARAHTWGTELEIKALLTDRFTLNLTGAYLQTRFDEYLNPSGAAGSDYTGNNLPLAPELSGSAILSYRRVTASGAELNLSGSVQYVGSQDNDVSNAPDQKIPERTTVDLWGDFRPANSPWSASVRVRNLLDEDYIVSLTAVDNYGVRSAAYNEPRTVLLSLRYDF